MGLNFNTSVSTTHKFIRRRSFRQRQRPTARGNLLLVTTKRMRSLLYHTQYFRFRHNSLLINITLFPRTTRRTARNQVHATHASISILNSTKRQRSTLLLTVFQTRRGPHNGHVTEQTRLRFVTTRFRTSTDITNRTTRRTGRLNTPYPSRARRPRGLTFIRLRARQLARTQTRRAISFRHRNTTLTQTMVMSILGITASRTNSRLIINRLTRIIRHTRRATILRRHRHITSTRRFFRTVQSMGRRFTLVTRAPSSHRRAVGLAHQRTTNQFIRHSRVHTAQRHLNSFSRLTLTRQRTPSLLLQISFINRAFRTVRHLLTRYTTVSRTRANKRITRGRILNSYRFQRRVRLLIGRHSTTNSTINNKLRNRHLFTSLRITTTQSMHATRSFRRYQFTNTILTRRNVRLPQVHSRTSTIRHLRPKGDLTSPIRTRTTTSIFLLFLSLYLHLRGRLVARVERPHHRNHQ